MADQKPDRSWVALERDLDEVAEELGTAGMGELQAERHELERDLHREYQRLRQADDSWSNLKASGWREVKKGVLAPPEADSGGT